MLMIILYALAAIGVGAVFYGVDKLVSDWFHVKHDAYEYDPRLEYSTQPDLYQARVDFFKDESAAGHQGDVGVSGPSGVRFDDFVCDLPEVERRMRVSIAEQARL
jgi:hypothetical protein